MSFDNKHVPGPVAIVGLACRFPGDATSPSKFWDLLKNGKGESLQGIAPVLVSRGPS